MAAIETRGNKTGNFLKKELWPEESYCRKTITLTVAGLTETKSAGEVVYSATDNGTYGYVPDGALANPGTGAVAVIVDPNIDDILIAATGPTVQVAALVRGPSVLRKGGLSYAGSVTFSEVEAHLLYQDFTLAEMFSVKRQG